MKRHLTLLGSEGYIGSSLYQYLSQFDDLEISTIDVEYFGRVTNSSNHRKLYYSYLTDAFVDSQNIFILCAGHSSVKMSQNDPSGAFYNNVVNFFQFLQKLRQDQLFIYMSSSSVYAGIDGKYLTESHLCYRPQNIYDLTKAQIDQYAGLSDKTYFGLRLGTVAGAVGPNTNLRIDTCINGFFSAYKNGGVINIFDGHVKRPIAGMNDICRAVKAIIDSGNYNNRGIYNIGSVNRSINGLGNEVSKLLNCKINYTKSTNNHLYNFTINPSSFTIKFEFQFQDTIKSIIKSLDDNWDKIINKGVRDKVPDRSKVTEKYV
jgi:nucleoside-diphosphate-sugar epimerase